jgi:hypothetical protein
MPNRDFDEEPSAGGRKLGYTVRSDGGDERTVQQEVLWEIGVVVAILLSLAVVGHLFAIAYGP